MVPTNPFHIDPSDSAMSMAQDPTTSSGMINITVHLSYPSGMWGPAHVSFWLSPLYDLTDTEEAAEMIESLLQSGAEPILLVDAAGGLWPFFPATVDQVLLATPSPV